MAGALLSPEWFAFASLISGAILVFWPMIHMRLNDEHHPLWLKIDHYLPWLPGLSIFLVWLLDIIAHLTLDMDQQRVATRLTEDSSIISRLAVALTGWTSWALLVMIGFGAHLAMTVTVLDQRGEIAGDSHRIHDAAIIWFGVFWVMMMFALMPANPFQHVSFDIPSEIPPPPSMWDVLLMTPTILLAGWMIGFGILHLADCTCTANWPDSISRPHPATGWFVALPVAGILLGFTLEDLNTVSDGMALTDLILDEVHGRRTAFLLAFSGTLILTSCALHTSIVSAHRTRVGTGRWKGLAASVTHTLFWILFAGWAILSGLPGVDTSWGAISLLARLTTPLILIGAIGLLIPQIGFDDKARPELWGWTLLLMLATPALALWEPRTALISLALLPALSMGIIIPAIFESDVRLSKKRRVNWTITILVIDVFIFSTLLLFAFDYIGMIAVIPGLLLSTLFPGIMVHAWPEHID